MIHNEAMRQLIAVLTGANRLSGRNNGRNVRGGTSDFIMKSIIIDSIKSNGIGE